MSLPGLHCIMKDNSLRSILQSSGVQDTFIDPLIEGGWTADQFDMMAQTVTEFEDLFVEILDKSLLECITIQQRAAIRVGLIY